MKTAWPTRPLAAELLEYDWRSGLWEFTGAAVVTHCEGFIQWLHVFMVPE